MAVRSARLAGGYSGAANVTTAIYTCPAGVTAILKDIRLATTSGAASSVILAMTSGALFSNIYVDNLAGGGATHSLQPWIVLEPGDQLVLNTGVGGGVSFWVSGAELDGVAP